VSLPNNALEQTAITAGWRFAVSSVGAAAKLHRSAAKMEVLMFISHKGKMPDVHPSAYIAPTATICGDVEIGSNCRVMHGASIIAEGGKITIGEHCIIFENAVVRSNANHSATIGNFCLIGPNAHVVGCTIEDEVFIATGAAIFHSAHLGKGSQIRINAVVHLKSYLEPGALVPIGWIAVGNPAKLFSPDQHEEIWKIQEPLQLIADEPKLQICIVSAKNCDSQKY
jgi:carbonic anhydrase/acetyltransferase-like protein (isoleucine patch superfamily)